MLIRCVGTIVAVHPGLSVCCHSCRPRNIQKSDLCLGGQSVRRTIRQKSLQSVQPRTIRMSSNAGSSEAFTIIGGGRIGLALQDMSGGKDVVLGRGQAVDGSQSGPIIVCTRNDDLPAVLEATPSHRQKALVFIQNGMLQPWLAEQGLQNNTQALIYFAVAKKGAKPIDGKTDVNPEGLTAATGPHAQALADRLAAGGLSCKVLDASAFQKSMLEKLIWISAFMLVGARHKVTVGEVERDYRTEVVALIEEMAAAGAAALGIEMEAGLVERLCAYTRSVADYPSAVKEFRWRNGWFYDISRAALAEGKHDPLPLHTGWLKEVGAI